MTLAGIKALLTATLLILMGICCAAVLAQSGRGSVHGYVAFEDLSYIEVAEKNVHATVELRGNTEFNHELYTAKSDEHGSYDLKSVSMGEYILKISSPGYRAYQTEIYLPSDFTCSLAVMLKKEKHKPE
jgi:hypothetical protein